MRRIDPRSVCKGPIPLCPNNPSPFQGRNQTRAVDSLRGLPGPLSCSYKHSAWEVEKVPQNDYLDREEWALYKLIWDRFVASQMASAVFLQTTVEIKANDGIFTAVGTVPTFLGFMSLYVEGEDNSVSI